MSIIKAGGQFIQGEYKESAETILNLIKGWIFAKQTYVVVGIPKETNVDRGDGDSNASILYKNEKGEPAKKIPARPVLVPAISQDDVQEKIRDMLMEGLEEALVHGDVLSAEKYYDRAGMVGRDACKKYITDGTNLAPNAESTILRKGSSKPLIDTGSMLNSISYAVRKK